MTEAKRWAGIKFKDGSYKVMPLEEYYANLPEKGEWSVIGVVEDAETEGEAGVKFALQHLVDSDALEKLMKAYLEEKDWKIEPHWDEVDATDLESLDRLLSKSVFEGLTKCEEEGLVRGELCVTAVEWIDERSEDEDEDE